jgi:hypothetical protein
MNDISYVKYEPSFKNQLIKYLGLHWTSLSNEGLKRKLFEWKYEDNPYTTEPLCYLAVHQKNIVGHLGYIVQKYKIKDKEYLMGSGADGFIHPEYRRLGIFSKLEAFSFSDLSVKPDIDFLLALTANQTIIPSHIKLGYVPIGEKREMCLFSALNYVKKTSNIDMKIEYPMCIKNKNFLIEISKNKKIKLMSDLSNKFRNENKFNNFRCEKFYNWRFSHPLDEYIFVYCEKLNGDINSFLILKKNNYRSYSLMEYFYTDHIFLKILLKEVVKKLKIPFVWTYFTSTRPQDEISFLQTLGFRTKEDLALGVLKKLGLFSDSELPAALVRPVGKKYKKEEFILNGIDTRDIKNWEIFQLDAF